MSVSIHTAFKALSVWHAAACNKVVLAETGRLALASACSTDPQSPTHCRLLQRCCTWSNDAVSPEWVR
jgi:hypothetical protein